jgi:hypothetical protein
MYEYITASVEPPITRVNTIFFLRWTCFHVLISYLRTNPVYTIKINQSTQSKDILYVYLEEDKSIQGCVRDHPIKYKSKMFNLIAFTNVQWSYRKGNIPPFQLRFCVLEHPLDRSYNDSVSYNGHAWHYPDLFKDCMEQVGFDSMFSNQISSATSAVLS